MIRPRGELVRSPGSPTGLERRAASEQRVARTISVEGLVQGVGFRPFVDRLARRFALAGWVRNQAGEVTIHVEGPPKGLQGFEEALHGPLPPLARIDRIDSRPSEPRGLQDFQISASREGAARRQPVSPDVATCDACLAELNDADDRRYGYPFITCTDCGPRFTVIESMPYDRERTSMRSFVQCEACRAEYETPGNRRHHSQTNACARCGPTVWFEDDDGSTGPGAIGRAAAALRDGRVVAIRGVGGFHLAVDATNERAVQRLRDRKGRDDKPLAIMVRTLGELREIAAPTGFEERLLSGVERPIVLVGTRDGSTIPPCVAPGLDQVGAMLAYTPLHHLLLERVGAPLVMTSGNRSNEPIAIGNDEARRRLGGIADAFLVHDREILSRCDDSVVRVRRGGRPILLRRARGYAPFPLPLPVPASRALLAVGPHLKNTFTLAEGERAWISPHIGDLETLESLEHFHACLDRLQKLFRFEPRGIVRDLHPGYLSTRIAEQMESEFGPATAVQHHHAHIAAVLAEHGLEGPVVGLAFDGTGYGDDGTVWGGEILVADLRGYRRVGHLRPAPLPGGDLAVRTPWRSALGYALGAPEGMAPKTRWPEAFRGVDPEQLRIAGEQGRRRLNAPLASSMGRLFDAAAAVIGVRHQAGYEGQAAMELEALASRRPAQPLPFPVRSEEGRWILDPIPLLDALDRGRRDGVRPADLSAAFHESVAAAAVTAAARVAEAEGLDGIALGGGVFQNARLLDRVIEGLESRGLRVWMGTRLSPNDGALSYGQAAVAAALDAH